jgi:hypothetical protein
MAFSYTVVGNGIPLPLSNRKVVSGFFLNGTAGEALTGGTVSTGLRFLESIQLTRWVASTANSQAVVSASSAAVTTSGDFVIKADPAAAGGWTVIGQ